MTITKAVLAVASAFFIGWAIYLFFDALIDWIKEELNDIFDAPNDFFD